MKATYKIVEGKTARQLANEALKAMSLICGYDNGTINNPYELASSILDDGRTLIRTIFEDGFIRYNDGWYIVEVDYYSIYVDVTGFALNEMGNPRIWDNWLRIDQDAYAILQEVDKKGEYISEAIKKFKEQ